MYIAGRPSPLMNKLPKLYSRYTLSFTIGLPR